MTSNDFQRELGFELRDHDVRIERGAWVYFVRGVRSVEPLREDLCARPGGFVEATIAGCAVSILDVWWRRKKAWKVGVLRVKGSRWGPSGHIKVHHKEVLDVGVAPSARIVQLAEEVRAGRFDTT